MKRSLHFCFSTVVLATTLAAQSTSLAASNACVDIFAPSSAKTASRAKQSWTDKLKPKTSSEIAQAERKRASKALNDPNPQVRDRYIAEVRAKMKDEFKGSDAVIDAIIDVYRPMFVKRGLESVAKPNPMAQLILSGPPGRGKTSPLLRAATLLDLRVAMVTPEEGAVALPFRDLRRFADQRSDGRPFLYIVDEIGHMKRWEQLQTNKVVPIEDQLLSEFYSELPPNSGIKIPTTRVVDEQAIRNSSLSTYMQATGGGEAAREDAKTPKAWANEFMTTATNFSITRSVIESAKETLKSAGSAGEKGAAVELIKQANGQITEFTGKYTKALASLYNIVSLMAEDRPDFFDEVAYKEFHSRFASLGDMSKLSSYEIVDVFKRDPETFIAYISLCAERLPAKPIESYSQGLLAITGNNDALQAEVKDEFNGENPTAEEYRKVYEQRSSTERTAQWILPLFNPNSDALLSRIRVNNIFTLMPFSPKEYAQIAVKNAKTQSDDFRIMLEQKAGIRGVSLHYDESVLKLLENEAVDALAGVREFAPRTIKTLQPISLEARVLVAELYGPGQYDFQLNVSYVNEGGSRKLQLRATNGDERLSYDIDAAPFTEPRRLLMTDTQRKKFARYVASMIVSGMAFRRSYPRDVDLAKIRKIQDFTGWRLRFVDGYQTEGWATIFTVEAGTIGVQKTRAGTKLDDFDLDGRAYSNAILLNLIDDVRLHDTDFSNISRVVREANPAKNLSRSEIKAIREGDYTTNTAILNRAAQLVQNVLVANHVLVREITDELYEKGAISTERVRQITEDFYHAAGVVRKTKDALHSIARPNGYLYIVVPGKLNKNDVGSTFQRPDKFEDGSFTVFGRVSEALKRVVGIDPDGYY